MTGKESKAGGERTDESDHRTSESTGSSGRSAGANRYSRRRLLGGLAAGGAGLVAGCSGQDGTGDGGATPTATEGSGDGMDTDTPTETPTEEAETTIRMAARWANDSIDPMSGHTQLLRLAVFEPLIAIDYEARVVPGLATSWSASEDNRTWTFELRDDVTFHDGTAFDAEAMAFSLRRTFGESDAAKTAGTALSTLPVESVDVEGDYRLSITTETPYAPLPAHLTRRYAVAMSPNSISDDGEVTGAVGTGPFKFESWEGGEGTTTLSAYEDYYGQVPTVDTVEYAYISDAQTRELSARNGELDVAIQLPPESISRVESSENASIVTYQPPRLRFFTFNFDAPPTGDAAVRKAFNYGIDTQAINDSILEGIEQPAVGPWAPQVPWRNATLEGYGYDPARAESILADAGWELDGGTRSRDGQPLALTLWTYTTRAAQPIICEAVQSQLGEIGFDVEVRATGYGAMDDARLNGEANVTLENWSMYGWPPDPDRLTLFYHSESDMAVGYANDRVDQLLDEGRKTVDREERKAMYDEVQSIVMDELPLGYLTYPTSVVGVNDAVQNWQPHPTDYEWGFDRVSKSN